MKISLIQIRLHKKKSPSAGSFALDWNEIVTLRSGIEVGSIFLLLNFRGDGSAKDYGRRRPLDIVVTRYRHSTGI